MNDLQLVLKKHLPICEFVNVRFGCAISLLLAIVIPVGAVPTRIPSFGPNGTHWPSLVETPFLYDVSAKDVEVACTWAAIKTALEGLSDAQANAGVRILVQPGSLEGSGCAAGSSSVLNGVGNAAWTKRVTICPRDGYGSVLMSGGVKFTAVDGVCIAGFVNTGGLLFVGCDRSALAWVKTSYLKIVSQNKAVSLMEVVEVVIPDSELNNADVSQVGAYTYPVKGFQWDGCYFAPRYYISGTTPTPHTDTLQFFQSDGGGWDNWDFTLRDTAIFSSNNTALQTGGVDGIAFVNSYLVSGGISKSRYPVLSGGSSSGISNAINGAGQNWTVSDTLIGGGAGLSNPSGLYSDKPFVSVKTSTVSFSSSGFTVPQSGAWVLNTDPAFYIDRMPPYPTDTHLKAIWSGKMQTGEPDVLPPSYSVAGGVYDSPQTVAITTQTTGASIYYTTDGSTPTSGSALYTTPLSISTNTTIRAIAMKSGMSNSTVMTSAYSFTAPPTGGTPPTGSVSQPTWPGTTAIISPASLSISIKVTPSANNIDAQVALSKGPPSGYGSLAAIGRFNSSGRIDANNDSPYTAMNVLTYSAGITYTFEFSVNMVAKTYNLKVTPAGGSSTVIAENYAFRASAPSDQLTTVVVHHEASSAGNISLGDIEVIFRPARPEGLRVVE